MKLSVLTFLALATINVANASISSYLRRDLGDRDGRPGPRDGDGGGDGSSGPPPPIPGDLGIRFNKIPFPTGAPPNILPLGLEDYPVRGFVADVLKTQSRAASVVTERDYELYGASIGDYITRVGGLPSMPNMDPQDPYWADLEEVVQVQLDRLDGVDPNSIFQLPLLWDGFDIDEVAEAVHDEYPGYHQAELLKWIWSQDVEIDYDILPFRSNLDFIGRVVRLADLNTWAIGTVSTTNFCLKWTAGRPRPEEVAYMIAEGALSEADGVPAPLVGKIRGMMLQNATSFTAYNEGSPVHPSWPAMHSAASSASLWLAVVLDLSSEQYCEALRVDYAVAYARTVAGVHYPTDNIAGLNLGTEIMRDRLADHLAETYGSDRSRVRDKIESLRFDWADFDPNECTIEGQPV